MTQMEIHLRFVATTILLCVMQEHCLGISEVCLSVPMTVDECYAQSLGHPISAKSAKVSCLKRLMWHYEPNQTLTSQDLGYFSGLSGERWHTLQPKTGFHVRKEYRTLTDADRHQLNTAFQGLYKKGIMKKYADLHHRASKSAHNGAAFLAWHRVFLAMFEDELRLENPKVSLPYWDVSLDEAMDNPVNSIVWSSELFGNGNGDVVTGPFAGWMTSRGPLWREYGSSMRGRLTSRDTLEQTLTKCHTADISYPLRNPENEMEEEFVYEYHHNAVHNWVGGDMSDISFAAYDPVFYMFHAFIDYEWERFREHRLNKCGLKPETDYPLNTGGPGHSSQDLMVGFDGFKNIDGLKNDWTKNWYNYESRPECPNCKSPYLFCDTVLNRCVSHSRRSDYNAGYQLYNTHSHFSLPVGPFEPDTMLILTRIYQKYDPSPLSDCRTRESAKHDAKKLASKYNLPEVSPYIPGKRLTIITAITHGQQQHSLSTILDQISYKAGRLGAQQPHPLQATPNQPPIQVAGNGQLQPSKGHTQYQSPYQSDTHGLQHTMTAPTAYAPSSQGQQAQPPKATQDPTAYQSPSSVGGAQQTGDKVIQVNTFVHTKPASHLSFSKAAPSAKKSVRVSVSLPHDQGSNVQSQVKIIKGTSNPDHQWGSLSGGETLGLGRLNQFKAGHNTNKSNVNSNTYPSIHSEIPQAGARKYLSLT